MTVNCVVCDEPLSSAFLLDEWGERYCVTHVDVQACLWCGSHREVHMAHDVNACRECWDEVVVDDGIVTECAELVMNWLTSIVGQHALHLVPVIYGGLAMPSALGGTLGRTSSKWTGTSGTSEISTVENVPRSSLLQLLAHEYAHVLLIFDPATFQIHREIPTDELVVEGFCEVVSSEFLRYVSTERCNRLLNRMERNRNPVYGDGYRIMLSEMQQVGGVAALCSKLTGWQSKLSQPASFQPSPINVNDLTKPIGTSEPRTSRVPASIPMRPTIRRTNNPLALAGHRPQIAMPPIVKKEVVENPTDLMAPRPQIPMKPK